MHIQPPDNLSTPGFTWLTVTDRETARKLATRLVTRGDWFWHDCTEGESLFIVRAGLDLGSRVFRGLSFRVE